MELSKISRIRNALQSRFHRSRIRDFVEEYDRDNPTMVILPGGMGSRIHRTPVSVKKDPTPEIDELKAAWVGLDTLLGGLQKLRMTAHPSGAFLTGTLAQPFVALPNGPVDELRIGNVRINLGRHTPYTSAIAQLKGEFNLVVFGYDWRRSIRDAARHLANFLQTLEDRVALVHGQRGILRHATLVGHSQGGLVGAAFMLDRQLRDAASKRWCKRFVSIGTPFYGTLNHLGRYYAGEDMLKLFYGRAEMAKLVATLPGLFTLVYPGKKVWQTHFESVGNPEIPFYPLVDEQDRPLFVDEEDVLRRYWPSGVRAVLVRAAERERRRYCHPLTSPLNERVYHIRQGDYVDADAPRAVFYRWKPFRRGWNADREDMDFLTPHPQDAALRRSDGTTPYWSARLMGTPMENVMDFVDPTVDHQELMCHVETVQSLIHLEKHDSFPSAAARRELIGPRSDLVRHSEGVMREKLARIDVARRELEGRSDREARMLERGDVGEDLRDPVFWTTLDRVMTP